jgi:hypothetical protein
MKYKDLPSWVKQLKDDPQLASLGFSLFDEAQFKEANKEGPTCFTQGEKEIEVYAVGQSESFSNYKSIGLCVDTGRMEEIRITLNEADSLVFFYCEPKIEVLQNIRKYYMEPALQIPQENMLLTASRVRQATPVTFSSPQKKTLAYYYGHGDWDDMAGIESQLTFNHFLALYTICLATAEGVDGNISQRYTAFSASLSSLVRYKAFGTTLFFLVFEYIPTDSSYTKQMKSFYADKPFVQQFPDDAPMDILGMLNGTGNENLTTEANLFHKAQEGSLDSVLVLSVLSNVSNRFEEYFLPLASHPEIKIRDFVASEAIDQGNHKIIAKALECGVSKEVYEAAIAKYPPQNFGK